MEIPNIDLKRHGHEIFALGFFRESPSPNPMKITLRSFQMFLQIRGDIRKSMYKLYITSINDNGGKIESKRSSWNSQGLGGICLSTVAIKRPNHVVAKSL